jgi:murein L,D-transpeptidase YcbB/YkuD
VSPARRFLLCLALVVAAVAPAASVAVAAPSDMETRLDDPAGVKAAGRPLDPALIKPFYAGRDYRLAWTGPADAAAQRLLAEIRATAQAQGLPPDGYDIPATASDIDHDLLVSESLARFGRDLASGRLSPSRLYGGLGPETRPSFDAATFLGRAAAGTPLAELTAGLAPADPAYGRLEAALVRYRAIVQGGGWPAVADGPTIRPGQADPRLPQIRRRLVASGDLDRDHGGTTLDAATVAALKHFQLRHGLDTDGSVGKQTRAELAVAAADRLRQIEANLERWRMLPRLDEPLRVMVNIPSQTLDLVEDGQAVLSMRVVVGDVKHQTPEMATAMTAVILNPTWTIPPSIASKEILPKLRRDPNYLAANNIRILDVFPDDSPEAEGAGTNWAAYHGHFPYRLRQRSGPDNALGRIKFYLKDQDAIYLHDTPQRTFFQRSYRALSHGCIRVEQPLELAGRLLGGSWPDKLPAAIDEKATRTLLLGHAVPVYLVYWTAWADADGTVHFRDDLYGQDARLLDALAHPRPAMAGQVAQDPPHAPL